MKQRYLSSKEHHRCYGCGEIIPEGTNHLGVEMPPLGELVYFCKERCRLDIPENRKLHRRKE